MSPGDGNRRPPKREMGSKYAKFDYGHLMTHLLVVCLPLSPVAVVACARLSGVSLSDIHGLRPCQLQMINNPVTVVLLSSLVAVLASFYLTSRPKPVYLLDFACYKPNPTLKTSGVAFLKRSTETGLFDDESLAFQKKILERSGLGRETYFPEALVKVPPDPCMAEARKEAETVMFGAIDELFARTGVKAEDVGILVVNCSIFSPTPSLSAMVVNKYELREDVVSYNLGGMGCSAGLISIDLVQKLLQMRRNTYALVVSMENITLNWYVGNNRSMLVSNCIFRVGAAAILLSNHAGDRSRSKYQLIHTVRTHKGADDRCYGCALQEEDSEGNVGVNLSKDLKAVVGDGLKTNITALGPLVLPLSEKLLFFLSWVGRKKLGMKMKAYSPNFKLAFQHVCMHTGGRGVLDKLEENLGLSPRHMEPSRMALYRYGNTSSSSIWYELGYSEAKGRVQRGDRVWQIAFGTGFKCNSAVWKALRNISPAEEKAGGNPWMEEIDQFPVEVPKISPIL